jgi:hypothetical protein
MNTRKMKIINRSEEMEKENKRPRTPEKAPSSTVPEHAPRTPEGPPPPTADELADAAKTLLNLQHSPAWCDPVRPLDILGGQYPDPLVYDFQITKSKRVDPNMQEQY